MKIFFRQKTGNTAGLSYTVPVAFGRGGIAIVRLRFATGSPRNWGSHAPQSWVKFWTLFKCPPKIQGVVGESFPLEGILSPEVRRGWPPLPNHTFPLKIFQGGRNSKFWPLIYQNPQVKFLLNITVVGSVPPPIITEKHITEKSFLTEFWPFLYSKKFTDNGVFDRK